MEVCANCGRQLGVGRFCTNCGQRVDDGPEPSEPLALPPTAVEPPPQARYPLFADDVVEPGPAAPPPAAAPPPPPPLPPPPPPLPPAPPRRVQPSARRRRRADDAWLPWAVGAVALLLVAMIGALLLMSDDDAGRDQARDRATTEPTSRATTTDAPRSPLPTDEPPAGEGPLDLARYASVDVPDTAPPNQDVSGNMVRYEAANMIDGVPQTCWRMPGSGAGGEIVFAFQEAAEISEVGLINGYAKTSGDLDWYAGNRRVLDVEWVFDDGTVVEQSLDGTRELQTVTVGPITTTTVTLRLLSVSDPGRGRAARDYTAISDVSLVGTPS
jgi:hypothetical protein